MQLLALLVLPLAAASYGQPSYAPAAAPAYGNYPAPAPAYPLPVAAPVYYPVISGGYGGRATLDDVFQGRKIRERISNPFFVPRYHGERHIDRDAYGSRWGSNFPRFRHGHHHHHHGDDYYGGQRHHHHHFLHQHQPTYVSVPVYQPQPAPAYPSYTAPAAPTYPAAAPAYPASAPSGNYY